MGQRWQKKVEQWTASQSGLSAEGAFMSSLFNLFDAETEFVFQVKLKILDILKLVSCLQGSYRKPF